MKGHGREQAARPFGRVARVVRGAFVLALLASTPRAMALPSATEKETARTLMKRGDALMASHEYGGALDAYRAADAIMGVPTTGLALARALERLGRLVEARDVALAAGRYPERADEPAPFAEARRDAKLLAADLVDRIPSVQLHVSGLALDATATVEIDGTAVAAAAMQTPWKLDPGRHTVRAHAQGYAAATADVTLRERESETVELALRTLPPTSPKPPAPAPAASRGASPLVPIGFGIGAAGVVVGAVTGILAWQKTSSIEEHCANHVCPADQRPRADTAGDFATVSTVAFAASGAALVLGAVGLLLPTSARATASIGPRSVGVSGAF